MNISVIIVEMTEDAIIDKNLQKLNKGKEKLAKKQEFGERTRVAIEIVE